MAPVWLKCQLLHLSSHRCFFVALLSATFGVLVLVVVLMFVSIQHYLHPESLRTSPQFDCKPPGCLLLFSFFFFNCGFVFVALLGNETWLMFIPLTPIKTSSTSLLILAFITVVLGFISLLLLTHLLGFHFYLCKTQPQLLSLLPHI